MLQASDGSSGRPLLVNRKNRTAGKAPKAKRDTKPAWPETHSGEGSASALELLRKLEHRDKLQRPVEPKHNG